MAEGGFMRRATDVGFTLVERIAQWEREYGAILRFATEKPRILTLSYLMRQGDSPLALLRRG